MDRRQRKESSIDHKALAERLADIDRLRSQVRALDNDNERLKERYESQITVLENEHNEEVGNLRSQIAEMDSRMKALESEKTGLTNDLARYCQGDCVKFPSIKLRREGRL